MATDGNYMRDNMREKLFNAIAVLAIGLVSCSTANADWFIQFDQDDFVVNDTFNDIRTFNFEIRLAGNATAGVHSNPELVSINYQVFGVLPINTPSGFPAFDLRRTIIGNDFYDQGSSLNFEIASGIDRSDGIQFSELTGGTDPIFVFNGREVGTGRYHPPLIELNSDGTGLFQNSNNMGGINPGNGLEVDVDFGEEYISELSFDPAAFTIGTVPEPSTVMVLGLGMTVAMLRRRR